MENFSRRNFLKLAGGAVATFALGMKGEKNKEDIEDSDIVKEMDKNNIEQKNDEKYQSESSYYKDNNPQNLETQLEEKSISQEDVYLNEKEQGGEDTPIKKEDNSSCLETILCQGLMSVAKRIGILILNKFKLENTGQNDESHVEEYLKNTSIDSIIKAVITRPIAEEVLFRLFPSFEIDILNDNKDGQFWNIGIPTSVLFAISHNLKKDETYKQTRAYKNSPFISIHGRLILLVFNERKRF